ncbi:hypothetical protein [Porphyrobacter sp. YT40]|uniref:hypothetical protein n=1 Tax=Porphyrobacter sp. YT40 TaxID=2547601 RepID=UPI001141C20A|nr:hypothetical protein [Porphyrobacter sp. YT40]QDH34505.1 hypothetical protein E2E27_09330 [Porphyrobacter sp. YT40]
MLAITLAALAMLGHGTTISLYNDGTFEVSLWFTAKDVERLFPKGKRLLLTEARKQCADKGAPVVVNAPVITGIEVKDGTPLIAMSGTYACRKD